MDDLISRQAAINALENTECELLPEEWDALTDAIMDIPSAQPERKKGKWTASGHCPFCGEHAPFWCMATTYYRSDFCPSCGARLDGDKNE